MQATALTRPDIRQDLESYLGFKKVPAKVPFRVERTFMDLRNLPKGIQIHSVTTFPALSVALKYFNVASVGPLVWVSLRVKIADLDEIIASKCAACDMRESWSWRNNGRGNHADDVPSERAIQSQLDAHPEAPHPFTSSSTLH